jgi:hypothetical protein
LNWNAGVAEHGDKGVDTEPINLASNEIADSWLGHAKQSGGLRLRKPTSVNQFAKADHEVRPDLEILGFRFRESEIAEDVSA